MKPAPKLAKTLLELLAACLLIVLMLRWFEHSQVYHPDRVLTATGAELGRPFEDVFFKASDGVELNGWFFPAGTNSHRRHLAVLVCHGNAGNISHRLDTCAALLATGVNVFVVRLPRLRAERGAAQRRRHVSGRPGGVPWLRQKGFAGTNIIAFGESLGGGVAAELAVRETVGGLVLQSTFTSIPDMGAELFPWLPVRWLGTIRYDTRSKLPRLHVPVLVMHSPADELVSFHHGKATSPRPMSPSSSGNCEAITTTRWPMTTHFIAGLEKFLEMVNGH